MSRMPTYKVLKADWVEDSNGGDLITVMDQSTGAVVLELPPMEMLGLIWHTLGLVQDALRAHASAALSGAVAIDRVEDIGPLLRQLRLERDYSVTRAAKRSGISVCMIGYAETGRRRLHTPTLIKYLHTLDACLAVFRR
jgi:hypothetical protein